MVKPLQIGIIGAGRIGTVHARTVTLRIPQARVRAIADPVLASAQKLGAELGVSKVTSDHGSILADPEIDAVFICSSTDTHARIISEAAQAGKDIFCEKPLDLNLERIDSTLQTVRQAGVKLMLGFNRRFDPDFKRVRDQVVAGVVGKPHLLRITSRDPSPPPVEYVKVSGGMFLDMTIHDFDMARFVMGCEVEELFVHAGVLVDPEIGRAGDVDTAIISLRFANGALGVIENSRRAVYGYDQRIEVFGSGGMLANQNRTPDTVVRADAAGVTGPLPLHFFMERYTEAYEAEIRSFIESLANHSDPPVGGEDGRRAILLGIAARKSHQEKRPVKLSEFDHRK